MQNREADKRRQRRGRSRDLPARRAPISKDGGMGGHEMSGSGTHFKYRGDKDQEPIQYKGCGLDDIFLVSGYETVDTEYGKGLVIKELDGLLKAISLHLVM